MGPFMPCKASLGINSRAIAPATTPKISAPIMPPPWLVGLPGDRSAPCSFHIPSPPKPAADTVPLRPAARSGGFETGAQEGPKTYECF